MRVVGLTGGIGSGKSALGSVLEQMGAAVVDADEVARRCLEPGSAALAAVVERFGEDVIGPGGVLDRRSLARIVFSDARALRDLEALTHPCIRQGVESDLARLRAMPDGPEVVVLEHPLLVEADASDLVDIVVVVEAPRALRLSRLVQHRGMTIEDAEARMAAQVDDETRRRSADLLVVNDGDLDALGRAASRVLSLARGEGTIA